MIRQLLLIATVVLITAASAQQFPRYGDSLYEPRLHQSGKDVMWLPTPESIVTRMLQMAGTTSRDLVYDLGAGDGRVPIAAAKQFGARAVGIEYEAPMAALAQRNVERASVADSVKIIQGDIFKEDFSAATVVTLYLLPELNQQLRPQLLKLRPGTRVVSYQWDMGEWEPDDSFREPGNEAYSWIVPPNVAGRWTLRDDSGFVDGQLDITQKFQRIGGVLTLRGQPQPLLGAYVQGEYMGFTFVHHDGGVRSVRLTVRGDALGGTMRFAGNLTPVTGTRR